MHYVNLRCFIFTGSGQPWRKGEGTESLKQVYCHTYTHSFSDKAPLGGEGGGGREEEEGGGALSGRGGRVVVAEMFQRLSRGGRGGETLGHRPFTKKEGKNVGSEAD